MDDRAEPSEEHSETAWRYVGRETSNGTVEIFDTTNDDAWIESDLSIDLS
jgi:hypothetical protein